MSTSENIPDCHTPPLHTFKKQASFLQKHLHVKRTMALEMVAYRYSFQNWTEIEKWKFEHKGSKDAAEYVKYIQQFADTFRQELNHLYRSDRNISKQLNQLTLIPYTISHSVAQGKFDWLTDQEVMNLYKSMYEDSDKPTQDIFSAIQYSDNNILTLISAFNSPNACMTDYRFSFATYFYAESLGDSVILNIVELDSLLHPPRKEFSSSNGLRDKRWFPKQVEGYLNFLIKCLRCKYSSGQVLLYNVNNMRTDLYDTSPQKPKGLMPDLIKGLVSSGAKVAAPANYSNCFGNGLSFSF